PRPSSPQSSPARCSPPAATRSWSRSSAAPSRSTVSSSARRRPRWPGPRPPTSPSARPWTAPSSTPSSATFRASRAPSATPPPPSGPVLPGAHAQPLRAPFTPADTANYATANATVLINVVKATPVITWTGPATDMTFGQALGPAQLNATATVNGVTVPGTFV